MTLKTSSKLHHDMFNSKTLGSSLSRRNQDLKKSRGMPNSSKKLFRNKNILAAFLMIVSCAIFTFSGKAILARIQDAENESSNDDFSGITTLMTAVTNRDIETIKYYTKSISSEINKKNYGGATALHIACRDNDFQIASILVDGGAEVNVSDNEGWTPLMRASLVGNYEIIELLLNRGATVDDLNSYGETAVLHATSAGCGKCVVALLRKLQISKVIESEAIRRQMVEAYEIASKTENKMAIDAISEFNNQLLKFTPFAVQSEKETEISDSLQNSNDEDEDIDIVAKNTKNKKNRGLVARNLMKHKLPKKYKLSSEPKQAKGRSKKSHQKTFQRALKSKGFESEGDNEIYESIDGSLKPALTDSQNREFIRGEENEDSTDQGEVLIDSFDVDSLNSGEDGIEAMQASKKMQKKYRVLSEIPLSLDEQIESRRQQENQSSPTKTDDEMEISLKEGGDDFSNSSQSSRSFGHKFSANDSSKVFIFSTERSDANYGKDLSKQNIPILKKYKFQQKNRSKKLPSKSSNGTQNLLDKATKDQVNATDVGIKSGQQEKSEVKKTENLSKPIEQPIK